MKQNKNKTKNWTNLKMLAQYAQEFIEILLLLN